MHSKLIYVLACFSFFYVAKGDEDLGNWCFKVEEGDNGICSKKFKVEKLEETCKDIFPCISGNKGENGPQGAKGDKGEKGSQGLPGECAPIGSESNPANSCTDSKVPGDDVWIFIPKPFLVSCKVEKEICLNVSKTELTAEDKDKLSTIDKPSWLWSATNKKLFEDFYGLEESQISHLISISDRVSLELKVHCSNFDLENKVQILLWDNGLVGNETTDTSPNTYTVLENGCKNSKPNEWGSAIISLETWSTAVKNFYVSQKTSDGKLYVQLNKLCFYS